MCFMRSLVWIAAGFCGQLVFGQFGPVSIGAKAGVPLSDSFDARSSGICTPTAAACSILNYSAKTKRFTFGPSVELRLPHGFGVEFDALYNRLNYDSYFFAMTPSSGQRSYFTSTRADRWNFPLLVKWRHNVRGIRPFIDGGITFDHISGVRSNFANAFRDIVGPPSQDNGTSDTAAELTNADSRGFVAGGGIDFRARRFLHLTPEIRYTRWFSENFNRAFVNLFSTNLNETTFLLGISF